MNSRQKNPQKTKLNKLWFWQWKWNIIKIIIGAVGGFVVQSLSHVQLFVTPWTVNARLPCPSVSPGVCSNSCTLNQCHPIISSPVTHFSSYPQSFPASGSFPITWVTKIMRTKLKTKKLIQKVQIRKKIVHFVLWSFHVAFHYLLTWSKTLNVG